MELLELCRIHPNNNNSDHSMTCRLHAAGKKPKSKISVKKTFSPLKYSLHLIFQVMQPDDKTLSVASQPRNGLRPRRVLSHHRGQNAGKFNFIFKVEAENTTFQSAGF